MAEQWMQAALREAKLAAAEGEVPIGAVVVSGARIIGRGRNARERLQDPTAHAEMLALTAASQALGTWRLTGAVLVVTLEPCPMCLGACLNARIARVIFGAHEPKAGACGSLIDLSHLAGYNHHLEVQGGVEAEAAIALMQAFFRARRNEPAKEFPRA